MSDSCDVWPLSQLLGPTAVTTPVAIVKNRQEGGLDVNGQLRAASIVKTPNAPAAQAQRPEGGAAEGAGNSVSTWLGHGTKVTGQTPV